MTLMLDFILVWAMYKSVNGNEGDKWMFLGKKKKKK